MNVLSALVVLVVLAITPSVLFLLFWKLLISLRDDALIEELQFGHGIDVTRRGGLFAALNGPARGDTSSLGQPSSQCHSCGSISRHGDSVCPHCKSALSPRQTNKNH